MVNKTRFIYILVTALTVFLLGSLSIQYSQQTLAETNPISISTSPDSLLFQVDNMKPGDWAERRLTIQNRGSEDFTYNSEVLFQGGSKKLYNEFLLEIENENGLLYKGKLSEFTGFEPRHLKTLHEEELLFIIRFPTELGNEFQGLEFEVEIKFIAEGAEQSQEPIDQEDDTGNNVVAPQRPISESDLGRKVKDGQILPSTATESYNYLVLGICIMVLASLLYVYNRRKNVNE
ncbi:LPXTG cell wall anchor domain-containing protein [Alkalihalobacillus sp. 1P02AB]|uniref:LPXTG cell wall anchor domain-containing protein n=1 Tax=Alkalihalobacillus sp. 1P02AB TaxID=3132260 RepID=UPI0039A4C6E7